MENLLIIFTRVPIEGHTKTRLENFLSKNDIVTFHKNLIKRLVNEVKGDWDLEIHYTPEGKEDILKSFLDDETLKAQVESNLFHKMEVAIDTALETYKKVALIGSDIYDISSSDIKAAFDALDNNDVVFNPSSDGGYSLVASKVNIDAKLDIEFKNKSMVLDETINNFNSEHISRLRVIDDIDTREDLLYNYFGRKIDFISNREILIDGKHLMLSDEIFSDLININNWRKTNEKENNI